MNIYDYDPELPAGFQEADFLQAQYEAEGARLSRLREAGFCTHGSAMGLPDDGSIIYPEQAQLKPGQYLCTSGCDTIFDSEEELRSAAPIKLPAFTAADLADDEKEEWEA